MRLGLFHDSVPVAVFLESTMRATLVSLLLLATGCGSLGIQPVKPVDTGGLDAGSNGDNNGDVNGGGSGSAGDGADGGDGGDGGESGDETPEGIGITSLTPNEAGLDGGTTVVVAGHGFTGDVDFFFSSAEVAVTVLSDTELTVLSPLVSTEGTVDVTVVSAEGTYTLEDAFTFTNNPGSGSDGGGSGGSGSGDSGSGGSGSGGSGSGGSGGSSASSFSGTYGFLYGASPWAGDYDCVMVYQTSGSAVSGCPGCDFAFSLNFNFDSASSYDPYYMCGGSSFSAQVGYDSDYYGGRGASMLNYYGSWVPLSTDVNVYNPGSGYWAWAAGYVDQLDWYYYYTNYELMYGYVR
jgi:hypothetical protein